MTYEVLDTDTGDVIADFSSFETAHSALVEYVEDHPRLIDELAIAEVDNAGNATELTPAEELLQAA